MTVKEAIKERRAYRSLLSVRIDQEIIDELIASARLAPSCFNNQPWRFVFVTAPYKLKEMREALSEKNRWVHNASLIIALFSRKKDDCIIHNRIYYQFDCGLAAGFLILRATELGLVAHPIAGFSPKKTRKILHIPDEYKVITLIIVGKHDSAIGPLLSEGQVKRERRRPRRKRLEKIYSLDQWGGG